MRANLKDARNSSIPAAINLAGCDPRFTALVNEAQQRLVLSHELWWQITERYVVQLTGGCIVWPRHVASIIAIAVCNQPRPVRNGWFEFLESGYGIRDGVCDCDVQLLDRGVAATFADISGPAQKVKLYSDVLEAPGEFGIFGIDDEGNALRTEGPARVWRDGLWLALPTALGLPVISPVNVLQISAIAKPVTNGVLRLYQWDPLLDTQVPIGLYDPDETRPAYRRSLLTGIADDSPAWDAVTIVAKREFRPVHRDEDWLLIPNLGALKHMMQAIQQEERESWDSAGVHEAKAREILEREAAHYIGPGRISPLRVEGGGTWNAGMIPMLY